MKYKRNLKFILSRSKRYILLLMCIFSLNVLFAQTENEPKVSLKVEDATLEQIFKELESASGYNFRYTDEIMSDKRKFTYNYSSSALSTVLTKISKDAGLDYKVGDKTVTVKSLEKKTVKGKLTDSQTGEPLIGATVTLSGTTQGTVTDVDGNYSIEVFPNSTLNFSYIGYQTAQVEVAGRTVLDFPLESVITGLDEVVVVGYGTAKKKDVTGAIVNVDVSNFSTGPGVSSVTEMMQGMIPGVTIMNDSGDPSEGQTVRIRGRSTLNSEGPLWIVDGIVNEGGVSPSEVESITILKDASAAIYGTRASGGVILVTTKKAKKELNVDFDVKYGWSTPWKKLQPMNAEEYCDYYTEVYENSGQDVPEYLSMDYFRTTRTNWIDAVMQTGASEDYNLTISGGTDRSTFSIFGNWNVTNGTLHNTFSKGGRLRIKSDHKLLKDRLTVGENITLSTSQSLGANTTSGYTGILISSIYYPASASVFLDNGDYSGVVDETNEEAYAYVGNFGDLRNPYATLDRANVDNPNINAILNGYAELDIWKGLKFRSNFTYKFSNAYSRAFEYRILEVGKVYDRNILTMGASTSSSKIAEQLLTYENTFGNHAISALAGYTSEFNDGDSFSISAREFSSEEESQQEFENATDYDTDTPSSSRWENSILSIVGRVAYSYNNRYYLTGIIRHDGTSKLAEQNRWGTFPSVSAAWRISDESFMSGIEFIDDLKIRASWGQMGNIAPLGNYAYSANLSSTSNILLGEDPVYYSAYYMNDISNENLKWETTTTTDVGFDAYLMNSRLSLSADYYNKDVSDMLNDVELPDYSGISEPVWMNVGEVHNEGIEFLIGWREQIGDFNYGVAVNVAHNKNKLIKYSDESTYESDGSNVRSILYPLRHEEGHPLYSFYLVKSDGIFQSDEEAQAYTKDGVMIQPNAVAGDIKFIDYDDDGDIDSDDKQFCGDYYPDFTYSININLGYKNWDCSMMFQGVQNVEVFAGWKYSTLQPIQGYNLLADAQDYWSESNTGADIPYAKFVDSNGNYTTASDWYLEDGSYLRLKTMTIGYTLPSNILTRVGISKLRLYCTGQNLLTFTNYSGFDPEVGEYGLDMLKYPQSRTVMFGASLSF